MQISQERRAKILGKIDGMLTLLFSVLGFAFTQLIAWFITILPNITSTDWGEYNWAKVPVAIFIGALLKGLDRKKHEDASPSTGLVELPKTLTN